MDERESALEIPADKLQPNLSQLGSVGFEKYSIWSIRLPSSTNSGSVLHHLIGMLTIYSIACRTLGLAPLRDYQHHKSACAHTAQVMIHISVGKVNRQERAESGWWPPAKGQRVNAIHFLKKKNIFLLTEQSLWHVSSLAKTRITVQSSFGIMDQFAFC